MPVLAPWPWLLSVDYATLGPTGLEYYVPAARHAKERARESLLDLRLGPLSGAPEHWPCTAHTGGMAARDTSRPGCECCEVSRWLGASALDRY